MKKDSIYIRKKIW